MNITYRAIREFQLDTGCVELGTLTCPQVFSAVSRDLTPTHEPHQVDVVTGFSHYPATTNRRILRPVFRWYVPGIHREYKRLWSFY